MAETAVETEAQNQQEPGGAENNAPDSANAKTAEFTEVDESQAGGKAASIDILLDMEVPVTVALGQTRIPIQRLLQLNPGSVLKLDKPIDMPAELYLKDSKFATGTIVVLEDKFAVRIQEILTTPTPDEEETK